ncbi:hypothetical protein B0H13DRAFT_2663682 [Mycena leptocephala]|nr:hypothetical protein B0H13DRAFT_2663682 [Mycena leptocephala]
MIDLVNLLVWKGYVRDGAPCRRLRAPSSKAQSLRINDWLHTRIVPPNFQEKPDDPIGPLVATPLVQVVLCIINLICSSQSPGDAAANKVHFTYLPPIPIPPSRSQLCRSRGSLGATRIRIDRLPATGTTQPVLSCLADGYTQVTFVLSGWPGGCALAFCVLRSIIFHVSFAASWGGGDARGCAPPRVRVRWTKSKPHSRPFSVTCGRSLPPVSLTLALVRLDGDEDADEDGDLAAHSRISMER